MSTNTTETVTREQYIAGLAAERRRRGLPQAAVATRMGTVRQTAISRWETGETIPDEDALARWADALGVERYPEPEVHPKCGTTAGYQRHKRRGEQQCDRCRNAQAVYMVIYRAARRTSAVVAA